ncbi:MAG: metallophosphoesterase, partial [Clostridia bacterium]
MQKNWNEAELNILKSYKEITYKEEQELAKVLKRSINSIDHKVRALGIPLIREQGEIKKKDNTSILIIKALKEELSEPKSYQSAIPDKVDLKGDTLVIQLTDLHAGKIVKNQEGEVIYNEKVFRERIDKLCSQVLKLLDNNIAKGVKIKDVVILSTGDLANGEGIYATQPYEQEIAPPAQVMLVVEVIKGLIVSLLARKLSVSFFGVRGNHGRTGKDTDVASNWDVMIYMILDFWSREVLKNPKLIIKYAETEHLVIKIRNHGYLLRHIAPEQVDSPAGRVKINEWARQHNIEAVVYGHYHHFGIFDCDGIRVFRGGSIVGADSLSESMAKHSEPLQIVWGVNE